MLSENPQKTVFKTLVIFVLIAFLQQLANAQNLDVAFVVTPDSVVEKMLDVAKVGPGDYLIDLGCGDGRINIAAAKRGAIGHGVDLDPQRIIEARENAAKHGVTDKVTFVEENVYDTDFSRATVITMYLFPSINVKLRPKFMEMLEPGTRIVSHDFGMDEWVPDLKIGRIETHAILLWIVPAKVAGKWSWKTKAIQFSMNVKQNFQVIDIEVFANGKNLKVMNSKLSGKQINFNALDTANKKEYVFSGKVEEGKIKGYAHIHHNSDKSLTNWDTNLSGSSADH